MIQDNENIFSKAFLNNEIDKFLVGELPYFFEAKSDDDEPQNVRQAFDSLIVPLWKKTHSEEIPLRLFSALGDVIERYPDKNRALYVAHDWLWYYSFCLNKKRKDPSGYYGDLFEVDISDLAARLKVNVEMSKKSLVGDHRWAGAAWNSQDGMWTPLLRISTQVRDVLGGPDFVPAVR